MINFGLKLDQYQFSSRCSCGKYLRQCNDDEYVYDDDDDCDQDNEHIYDDDDGEHRDEYLHGGVDHILVSLIQPLFTPQCGGHTFVTEFVYHLKGFHLKIILIRDVGD